MLEPAPLTPSTQMPPGLIEESRAKDSFSRQVVGLLLSMVIPGSGHLVFNKRRPAYFLLSLFFIFLLCFWPFRILRFYWGFLIVCVFGISLYLYSGVSACLSAVGTSRRRKLWII